MTALHAPALAPDPAVPVRDRLLDEAGMATRLAEALDAPVEACHVERVKYRVGESLRVLYRVELDGAERLVSLRTFRDGRDAREAQAAGVAHAPELGAALWTFPNDRRLAPPPAWAGLPVMAYSPEVRVTVRAPEGYAKHSSAADAERTAAVHAALAARGRGPRVARLLSFDRRASVVVVDAVDGEPVATAAGMALFGETLARLHELAPPPGGPFARLDRPRLATAAGVVAAARPELAHAAAGLAGALALTPPPREAPVWLHGDVHPKNCLLAGQTATLIDLDQSAAGPASADVGSVLARLRRDVLVGRLDEGEAAAQADAFTAGYAAVRPLPSRAALAWHVAACTLAEGALRAVNRVYEDGLAALPALLAHARARLEEAAGA